MFTLLPTSQNPALAENLIRARQAACSYSWRIPPSPGVGVFLYPGGRSGPVQVDDRRKQRLEWTGICDACGVPAGTSLSPHRFRRDDLPVRLHNSVRPLNYDSALTDGSHAARWYSLISLPRTLLRRRRLFLLVQCHKQNSTLLESYDHS
jgi:hypothetical protein